MKGGNSLMLLGLIVFYGDTAFSFADQVNICALKTSAGQCNTLSRKNEIFCKEYKTNVDCVLDIERGLSHLAKITSEEAYLAAPLLSDTVYVVGEVYKDEPPITIVVLATSKFEGDLYNLRHYKFCHPGFRNDPQISPLVLQDLEKKIIELDKHVCEDNKATLVEKNVRSLSTFFGDSCRPGPWTIDAQYDKELKNKYSSLCKLCPQQNCDSPYTSPFNDSLKCLIHNGGDLAITTLTEAKSFFGNFDNSKNFKYVCKDGSVQSASTMEPCVWFKSFNDLIIANRDKSSQVKSILQQNLNTETFTSQSIAEDTFKQALTSVLNIDKTQRVNLTIEPQALKKFVNDNRKFQYLDSSKECDVPLRWCTRSSAEQQKCQWLAQAALNRGIQPAVSCVQTTRKGDLACLMDIENNNADVAENLVDNSYNAHKKGLVDISYADTDIQNISKILLVVKMGSSIKSFSDLKDKKACIPVYAGKEWLAAIDTWKRNNVFSENSLDYGKLFGEFVGSSCAPGAKFLGKENSPEINEKLCDECLPVSNLGPAKYCDNDEKNKFYGNIGVLKCLENNGDFGVLDANELKGTIAEHVIALCKNNSMAAYPGISVDDKCALNMLISSTLVSRTKNRDYELALQEFDLWFGQTANKVFDLFDTFNGTEDLLVSGSARGLSFDNDDSEYIKDYKTLTEDLKKENSGSETSPAAVISITANLFLLCILSNIITYYYY